MSLPLCASLFESAVTEGTGKEASSKVVMYAIQCATIDTNRQLHWWAIHKR